MSKNVNVKYSRIQHIKDKLKGTYIEILFKYNDQVISIIELSGNNMMKRY